MPLRGAALTILAALAVQIPTISLAQGVSVAPTRILLDGRTRSATVYLSNRGAKTETYRIGLARYTMREDGAIVPADSTAADLFADELIRFSPRRVVLPPGGSQTVRLLVRRPMGTMPEAAEYRAHLSIRSVPGVPKLEEVENTGEIPPEYRDKVLVRPLASVETLVPIIIRFGKLEARASLASPRLSADHRQLEFALERQGDRSLYGEITILHRDPSGRETQVGYVKGLAVYTPLQRRTISQAIDLAPDAGGSLLVRFAELEAGGGSETADLVVPIVN